MGYTPFVCGVPSVWLSCLFHAVKKVTLCHAEGYLFAYQPLPFTW